jgi:hypothetical protein
MSGLAEQLPAPRPSALFFDKDARYPCTLNACRGWELAVAEAIGGPELKVYCYWSVGGCRGCRCPCCSRLLRLRDLVR